MSSKLQNLVILSRIVVIFLSLSPIYAEEGINELEEFVTVKPNSAFLITPTVKQGKIAFLQLQLPEEIEDLKAFVWDPVHHIPLFSGGDPNKIFAYTGHDDHFDTIVEDVLNVTTMEIDQHNELLLWTDSGKGTVEKMSLRTLERSIEFHFFKDDNSTFKHKTFGDQIPGCKNNCNQPLWGKVFNEHVKFDQQMQQSSTLMYGRNSRQFITASWDGDNVFFRSQDTQYNGFAIKEMAEADHPYLNSIYCGNFNDVAVVLM